MTTSTNETIQIEGSAVSWAAILAGAAAIAALSLILTVLGTGLGLSVVSPWAHSGASATTISVSAIIWITFSSLFAAGLGGYLAGRLRTKWATTVHTDEIYFRDTAHGFLAWAIAALVTAALLTSVIGSIVSGTTQAGASVVGGVATTTAAAATAGGAAAGSELAESGGDGGLIDYYIDSLFRKDMTEDSDDAIRDDDDDEKSAASTSTSDARSAEVGLEVSRIFMNAIRTGNLEKDDLRYVSQLVAQRTGLTQVEAEKRVQDTFTRVQEELKNAETTAREVADQVRKASAYTALWLFIALLASAFVASFTAIYGGRQRDL
ncbi:hypothetical protein [Nitrosomonas sp. ANs5]|uniref:hypothetical protein n=1 Tax=Nitrosomonas sp. ANs5 TaxID=3423941 RepID=UPI003D352D6D